MIFKDTNKIAYKKADKHDETHRDKNKINCKEKSILKVKSVIFDNMNIIDYLGRKVFVKVERPLGSIHPKYKDIKYNVNYGFLPNTIARDDEEQDAYIIGVNEPLDYFEGIVKVIIIRNDDVEDKLVVCDKNYPLTREEIEKKTQFQEKYFDTKIIM